MKYSFESIAKTNTTQTDRHPVVDQSSFESIAKTNTTQTKSLHWDRSYCLRVLLKQIQHKLDELLHRVACV